MLCAFPPSPKAICLWNHAIFPQSFCMIAPVGKFTFLILIDKITSFGRKTRSKIFGRLQKCNSCFCVAVWSERHKAVSWTHFFFFFCSDPGKVRPKKKAMDNLMECLRRRKQRKTVVSLLVFTRKVLRQKVEQNVLLNAPRKLAIHSRFSKNDSYNKIFL